jgi:hypothetical protein
MPDEKHGRVPSNPIAAPLRATMGHMTSHRHIHFVTGRLAAESLRETVAALATEIGFDYSMDVLPISVAALMTPDWIGKRLGVPPAATEVLLPGYCEGDVSALAAGIGLPVTKGPSISHRTSGADGCCQPCCLTQGSWTTVSHGKPCDGLR